MSGFLLILLIVIAFPTVLAIVLMGVPGLIMAIKEKLQDLADKRRRKKGADWYK